MNHTQYTEYLTTWKYTPFYFWGLSLDIAVCAYKCIVLSIPSEDVLVRYLFSWQPCVFQLTLYLLVCYLWHIVESVVHYMYYFSFYFFFVEVTFSCHCCVCGIVSICIGTIYNVLVMCI